MCMVDPLFPLHVWNHHKDSVPPLHLFLNPFYLFQMQTKWIQDQITDAVTLAESMMKMMRKEEPKEEVQQVYTAMKRNGHMVITNKNNEVVYHLPHFLKPYLVTREQLQKLADEFTEKNACDIDAISKFESSLR